MTAPVIIIITRPPAAAPGDPLPAEVEETFGPDVGQLRKARDRLDAVIAEAEAT